MRKVSSWGGAVFCLAIAAGVLAVPAHFEDPLNVPAQIVPLSLRSTVSAVTQVGDGFVAAGPRGHVLREQTKGVAWTQATVPVSTDLTALSFPTAMHGWAVGHDGVVLESEDGGVTWVRRLDGRDAIRLELSWFEGLASKGDPAAARQFKFLKKVAGRAAAWPFLDVWFSSDREGWLVGAFGAILHTTDAGRHWTPMSASADNPKHLHLYAVRGAGDDVYIAGEQGLLLRFDRTANRFDALSTPYKGTFFGVAVENERIIAYGLSGHALLSEDRGATWRALETGTGQSIVGHARRPDGAVLFATQDGTILLLAAGTDRVAKAGRVTAGEVYGIAAAGNDRAVVATATGPRSIRLSDAQ